MGANRGAIDAVVAAVCHDLGQRDGHGLTPPLEPLADRVPIAVLGRDIAPGRATAKPSEYAVDDGSVLFRSPATPTVRCLNRQQILQNTPFCLCQIASAQVCLESISQRYVNQFVHTA